MVSMALTGMLLLEIVEFSWYTILNMHYDLMGIMILHGGRAWRVKSIIWIQVPYARAMGKKSVGSSHGTSWAFSYRHSFISWPSSLGVVSR
jgi:hypothetical protein